MTIFVEVSGPFEWRPRLERIGALRRYHWLCFSCGTIRGGFNDMMRAIRDANTSQNAKGDNMDKTTQEGG